MNAIRTDAERRREVLSLFVRNPQTSDSVEGIARWRLLDEVVRQRIEETESILEELVELGFLEAITAPGVPRMFRLRPDCAERAAAYVRGCNGSNDT